MLILAIRFAAELFGFAAAGVLGASAPLAQPWPAVLAVAAPAAMITFWGLVAAPHAANPLQPMARELIGSGVLLAVAGLIAAAGQPGVAALFAVVVVVDHAVILALDPRPAVERRLAIARH